MSTEEAGTATYHATVTVVDDADPPVAASFAAGIEDLTDRTAYLKGAADSAETDMDRVKLLLPGVSSYVVRCFGAESVMTRSDSAGFVTEDPRPDSIARLEPPGDEILFLALTPTVPGRSYFISFDLYLLGQNWATLPSVQLTASLVEHDPEDGSYAVLTTGTDAPADVAAMNSARRMSFSFTPILVDPNKLYSLRIAAPSGGTNSGATRWLRYRAVRATLGGVP